MAATCASSFGPSLFRLRGQSTALVFTETHSAAAYLFSKNAILYSCMRLWQRTTVISHSQQEPYTP
jgi:hypothetical protein